MLTVEQQDQFDRFGVLRLPGAIPRGDAKEMCDRVWDALHKRYQVRRSAPDSWAGQRITGTHDLPKSATFAQVGSPPICAALDDLLGRGNWQPPERWGSLLVTFPESREQWDVPRQAWHLDYPASRSIGGLFAVRLFTVLAELPHGAGGTVFIAGSHRLVQDLIRKEGVDQVRSADARKLLIRDCPWVSALCSVEEKINRVERFMNSSATFDDVELRVIEMTGEPGDVLLTHPLMLHAPAKNCASVPRLVLSSTVYRSGVQPAAMYS